MEKYIQIFMDAYSGYWNYLLNEILNPSWHNYFYALIGVSLFAYVLEIVFPWRKNQSLLRKDFFIDLFYLFFNFFLFSLIAFNAISNLGVELFNDLLKNISTTNLVSLNVQLLPNWLQFLLIFTVADFIQWNIHRLLHYSSYLWNFHKVHHSIKEMGFAGHLRYHFVENLVYKSLLYLPLTMMGFGLLDFFWLHILTLTIGHINHSNVNINYGPLKYMINNPVMHIWHHAKELPKKTGVNFGISLSIWDYLFKTAYIPSSGRDIELGFPGDENYPSSFLQHLLLPFKKN